MADLVFGLATTAVKETVNIAKSTIEEEKKLQKSVQRDLMLISDEFEMMHSFLNVAKEHAADDMTTTCVRQVRDMALDVEDCIESILHLDNKSSWWRHNLPSCIPAAAPAVALGEAVSSIELLKARVKAMGQRNMRYNHIGNSSSKPAKQMHHQQAVDNSTASNILVMERDALEIWCNKVDLVMLINKKDEVEKNMKGEKEEERDEMEDTDDDEEEEEGDEMDGVEEPHEESRGVKEEKFYEIKEKEGEEDRFYATKALEKESAEKPPASATGVLQLQVIAVLGTRSDLGMMSIKKAYDDPKTCKSFACRAWVKLMHPFDPHKFIRNVLAQFYRNNHQIKYVGFVEPMDVMMAPDEELIKEFKKQINQKYLVVLEDVSTMVDWEAIRVYLPDKNNGSCIVVHTQQLGIGSSCVGHPHRVLKLEQYSADHSVCAIYKDSEIGGKTNKTKTAESWSKKIRVGRKSELGFIHCAINSKYGVTAIWGIPCVGKSYLAKCVYFRHVIECKSAEYYGWVTVSHPFNIRGLSRRLLINFHSKSQPWRSIMGIKDPIEACRELIQGHDCLVVIDGLQSTDEWDLIKHALALGSTQSRTIVITNEERIAAYCATSRKAVLNIEGLKVHEALDLFKKKIGQSDLNPEQTKQATHILHKCGGLPKVITAIARYLGNEELSHGLDSSKCRRLTDRFMPELENNEEFSSLRGLLAWMHSYFRTCPDFLKPCIFYLSIFPLNHSIRRRRLLRRWIAEGYSRGSKVEGTAEETAEGFFYQLVRLSMIQEQHEFGTVRVPNTHFKVNGFFREYIMSRSMEENLVFALDGHCRKNSFGTGRHLTIQRSWDRDERVFEGIDLSRLRSLTVFGKWKSCFISDKINMMILRVLDLEDASDVNDDDVEKMARRLPRLKFLSLRGCKEVKHLPDSLGNLRQLQTLDVRDTSIAKLPKCMVKLKKLQYIRAGHRVSLDDDTRMVQSLPQHSAAKSSLLSSAPLMCRPRASSVISLSKFSRHTAAMNGVKVPRNLFVELSDLHTLGAVNISGACRKKAALEDLRFLTQLHKLEVSGINRSNSQELFYAISGLHHLKTLSVQVDKDNQGCFDGTSPPPESLRSLKLYGLVGKMPPWIEQLRNLKKLSLQSTMLPEGEISILSELPSLDILRLCVTEPRDGKLDFSEGKKLDVLVLDIVCNSRLKAVKFNRGLINVLKIRCCPASPSLQFYGLSKLNCLTEVWLSGTYNDWLRQDLDRQLSRHRTRPILNVEEPCMPI